MSIEGKRGQVAIFVVVAIALVAVILLVFLIRPEITNIAPTEFSPNGFLKECIKPTIDDGIETLSKQGGYENPEGFVSRDDVKIKYLCYTNQFYETCQIQQPFIKNHFESELKEIVRPVADNCFNSLKSEYERQGFGVSSLGSTVDVDISSGVIRVGFDAPTTITKDTTRTFDGFEVVIESEMYDLLLTADSIIEFEATYGDSETTLYMQYYPDLVIRKPTSSVDYGTTIYTVENVVTGEEFTFASRSLVFPPGLGLGQ